ncbi:TetR/AcrR family transcriptional regulator [Nocardia beijingensis]|uniref:TetR/AcrR family transcriptional regulator n=1 Tax=Nocardia beijingensis TaxID=95162 RepID=UPI0018962C04|nr:TetR/AcrR family transcriptional regulator [Nocardia beijingensis]MBF6465728.1 TetR/AcrR family transcriptional regulator [Nocardia beijingensis]
MPTASKATTSSENVAGTPVTRILDAALVLFEQVGVKKTTIEEVARKAGVDRVTVYRHVGGRDDLVQAVISREVAAVLAEITEIAERHDDLGELVADIFVTVITRWRTNPLVERMLTLEPARVVLKLTVDGAAPFAMSVHTTAAALQRAVERGILPLATDLNTRAEIVCRIVHSLILAPHGLTELETDEQLAEFARTYLVPVVAGPHSVTG